MTNPMTPTEQDKELREKINSYLESVFSQGVRAGKDVATETYEDFDAWRKKDELDKLMQLITTDRKRVELEARIDELEHIKILHRKEVYTTKSGDDINIRDRIAELKAQQEEV